MGVRTDVKLKYGGKNVIYLYSHWDEVDYLKDIIREVLKRQLRWDDSSYLARMIFSAMVKDDIDGETGYGLSLNASGDSEVEIDLYNQKVDGIPFKEFIED